MVEMSKYDVDNAIYQTTIHCLSKLEERAHELEDTKFENAKSPEEAEQMAAAEKEIIESGAKTIYRFAAVLRDKLGIELDDGHKPLLTN